MIGLFVCLGLTGLIGFGLLVMICKRVICAHNVKYPRNMSFFNNNDWNWQSKSKGDNSFAKGKKGIKITDIGANFGTKKAGQMIGDKNNTIGKNEARVVELAEEGNNNVLEGENASEKPKLQTESGELEHSNDDSRSQATTEGVLPTQM